MTTNEKFLQEAQAGLNEIVKPYQVETNRRQRLADFMKTCMRNAARNDFLQLDEQLKNKIAGDVEDENGLEETSDIFDRLRKYANEQVERYRM